MEDTIRSIIANNTYDEHKAMFEFELKLLGYESKECQTNLNEYIITGKIIKSDFMQLNKKWYVRNRTKYYDREFMRVKREAGKRILDAYGVSAISVAVKSLPKRTAAGQIINVTTILEFMGPRL